MAKWLTYESSMIPRLPSGVPAPCLRGKRILLSRYSFSYYNSLQTWLHATVTQGLQNKFDPYSSVSVFISPRYGQQGYL